MIHSRKIKLAPRTFCYPAALKKLILISHASIYWNKSCFRSYFKYIWA